MSDYISKSAFIEDIKAEITNIAIDGLKGTPRSREELYQLIERIDNQPTVDEKEIIRKQMERIVERLEQLQKEEVPCEGCPFYTEIDCYIHCDEYKLMKAIEIVKEEGGIE